MLKYQIATGMPKEVVDSLETIHIQQRHGERLALLQPLRQLFIQRNPFRQPC